MSQPSTPWTGNATDPLFPDIKQESCTSTPPNDFYQQHGSEESFFSSTNDVFENFTFPSGDTSLDCTVVPTAPTPDFSRYAFTPDLPTPHPYAPHHAHRPLPFRALKNNTPITQHPHGSDRRRSLSHSAVDRIAVHHPTFVRLQGSQSSRASTPDAASSRHIRSVSQGPTYLGRPLRNADAHAFPRSSAIGDGTRIGTPMSVGDGRGSRKRVRYPRYAECGDEEDEEGDADVEVRLVRDPGYLAHSRRIIEIGAMAVRKHCLAKSEGGERGEGSPRERVLRKLEDVERYLQRNEEDNGDALKGCGMIREALVRRAEGGDGVGFLEYQDTSGEHDGLELPSTMMPEDGLELFGGFFGEEDVMSLLAAENERLN